MIEFVDKNGRIIRVTAQVVKASDDQPKMKGAALQRVHVRDADEEIKSLLAFAPDSEFASRP